MLERVEARAFVGGNFIFNPMLNAVHRDPRFMSLVARTGLVTYWRTTGIWPDFCADESLPYRCEAEAEKALPAP